jgi:hypothetical protein
MAADQIDAAGERLCSGLRNIAHTRRVAPANGPLFPAVPAMASPFPVRTRILQMCRKCLCNRCIREEG